MITTNIQFDLLKPPTTARCGYCGLPASYLFWYGTGPTKQEAFCCAHIICQKFFDRRFGSRGRSKVTTL